MNVTTYTDASVFLGATMPALLQNESSNCLILGNMLRWQANPDPQKKPFCLLAAVHNEEGTLILAAMHQKSQRLLLASPFTEASLSLPALPVLFNYLVNIGYDLNGCVGAVILTKCFANLYHSQTGGLTALASAQHLLECTKVISPSFPIPGHLRVASLSDLATITAWSIAFVAESIHWQPQQAPADIAAIVELAIKNGQMHVWEVPGSVYNYNGTDASSSLVCMAQVSRKVQTRACISFVYTPVEHRGKGFASHCVAALTKKVLEEFQAVVLYTDSANPISNHVYEKVGYKKVDDMDNWAYGAEAEEFNRRKRD